MTESVNTVPGLRADGFRAMMRGFPTGVSVVTALDGAGRPWGMTCSSVCSVTLEPPTLLVCLRDGSPTLDAVLDRRTFSVNLLHGGARAVAELFASGDQDRFDRVRWHTPPDGGPHLAHAAHTIADCTVGRINQVGTHVVVFGEVTATTTGPDREPLLYGFRQYRTWPVA